MSIVFSEEELKACNYRGGGGKKWLDEGKTQAIQGAVPVMSKFPTFSRTQFSLAVNSKFLQQRLKRKGGEKRSAEVVNGNKNEKEI